MFTKYYVLNKRGKFGVTIFMHYTDFAIFVGAFYCDSPCTHQLPLTKLLNMYQGRLSPGHTMQAPPPPNVEPLPCKT